MRRFLLKKCVQQEGFRVVGSPIGTDAFMNTFVAEKVKEAQSKIVSIKIVGLKSPRAAHRLLTCCASKLMSFLSSTVPPHIRLPFLRKFDAITESAFFEILSVLLLTARQTECSVPSSNYPCLQSDVVCSNLPTKGLFLVVFCLV